MQQSNNIQQESIMSLRHMYNNNDFSKYTEEEFTNEWTRRQQLRDAEEAKKLTTKQKLQFILKNDPEYKKYVIDKIYEDSFCNALTKALPYTYFSHGCNSLLTKYKVDFNATVKEEAARFENFVTKDLGLTIPDFKLYYYHSSLFTSYWFRKRDEKDQYSMDGKRYTNLANLILFLVDGVYNENYAQANKVCDDAKIGYFNSDAYTYTIGNITVKRFANGRTDIKGLTTNQVKVMDKLFAIHDKLKNR